MRTSEARTTASSRDSAWKALRSNRHNEPVFEKDAVAVLGFAVVGWLLMFAITTQLSTAQAEEIFQVLSLLL
jgi:hypothetical protein